MASRALLEPINHIKTVTIRVESKARSARLRSCGRLEPSSMKKAGSSCSSPLGDKRQALVTILELEVAQPRPFGLCKGEFRVPDDFDEPSLDAVL